MACALIVLTAACGDDVAAPIDVADGGAVDAGVTGQDGATRAQDVATALTDGAAPGDASAPDAGGPDSAAVDGDSQPLQDSTPGLPDAVPGDAAQDGQLADVLPDTAADVPSIDDSAHDSATDTTTGPDTGTDAAPTDTSPTPTPSPLITEVMASNDLTLTDEDGDSPDWIELHNPTPAPIDLDGWHLTDDPQDLGAWTFPPRTLEPGAYLLVMASGKDRAPLQGELHTGFKLSATGEWLALVRPDGTIAHSLDIPPQLTDVSWGLPTQQSVTPLVAAFSPCLMRAGDGPVDPAWLVPGADEAPFSPCTTGVGWDLTTLPKPPQIVADSVAGFSGEQGKSGWWYGFWDAGADLDQSYDPIADFQLFPHEPGPWGPESFWSGAKWDWFEGNPPWTELHASGGHPSGTNTGPLHHAIRRWVSTVDGPARIQGALENPSDWGDGVVGRVLVDGAEVWSQTVDGGGVSWQVDVTLTVGALVDLVIDPGPAGNDGSDGSTLTARVVYGDLDAPLPTPTGAPVADSVIDWSIVGAQGESGWTQGYWDRSADADGKYAASDFTPFPRGGGGFGPGDFWDGSSWQWYGGDPPWTMLGSQAVHPNGPNSGAEHWAIRRWTCEVAGAVTVTWTLRKTSLNGGGVSGRVFHNGVEVDVAAIAGVDDTGVTRTVGIAPVQPGDAIDVAVTSTGPSGDTTDGWDGSVMTVTVRAAPDVAALLGATSPAPAVLLRQHFSVDDPSQLNRLDLRMRVDDGFVAWLNGQPLAALGAPEDAGLASLATADRAVEDAVQPLLMDVSAALDSLQVGDNVLSVLALDGPADDATMLAVPELTGRHATLDPTARRWFTTPTPGAENGTGTTLLGPIVASVTQGVAVDPDAPVIVEAVLVPTVEPVAGATLTWRVGFGPEQLAPLSDDGTGGDAVAGDGVYSAMLPGAPPATLLRWAVTAKDTAGATTRSPAFAVPTDSEQYHGTIVHDAAADSALPVFHLYVENPAAMGTSVGTRGAVWYDGELYDNVAFDSHGQSTKSFLKKSWDLDFPKDHRLRLLDGVAPMKDLNLLTNWADKSKVRNTLAWEAMADAGIPYHLAYPVRVQLGGAFYAVYDLVEDGDDRWLERLGLDPRGALYKLYDGLVDPIWAEKKTRKSEGTADIEALIAGLALPPDERTLYLYDHVDIPGTINTLAGLVVIADKDCCHKNYYLYRDTEGSGEWRMMPWDLDLSFGHDFTGTYLDDTLSATQKLFTGKGNNALIGALYEVPSIRAMYLRRVRTLVDALVQVPETPPAELRFEARIAELLQLVGPDAALDEAAWDTWGVPQTMAVAAQRLIDEHLTPRRVFLTEGLEEPLPPPQGAVALDFGPAELSPLGADGSADWLTLDNFTGVAVDASGWRLEGPVRMELPGGTVVPAGGTLFVVADAAAFRHRTQSPKGGEGWLVVGGWTVEPNAQGAAVVLLDASGVVVATLGP